MRLEVAGVGALCPAALELGHDGGGEELLRLDLRDPRAPMRTPVQEELGADEVGKGLEDVRVLFRKNGQDGLLRGFVLRLRKLVVHLLDQNLKPGDGLGRTFRQ